MKAMILVSVAFLLSACGGSGGGSSPSATPVSKLANENVYLYNGVNGSTYTAIIYFSSGGTFTIGESFPNNCGVDGTWSDSNPGQLDGTVVLHVQTDGCNVADDNQTLSYQYVISNGTIFFN